MGSEFSFEDLNSQEVEKYSFKWLKDAKEAGQDVHVMERIPKNKSGYSKQIIYIAKKFNNPVKIEYYNRRVELLKVAHFKGYKSYKVGAKSMYRAASIEMHNVQTRKKSIFSYKKRKLSKTFHRIVNMCRLGETDKSKISENVRYMLIIRLTMDY